MTQNIFVMIMYMTTKKQQSLKNKSRSNRKQKQQKQKQQKQQQFFIGGTCAACGACMANNKVLPSPALQSIFKGGTNCTRKRRGGGNDNPVTFDGTLPQRYYYKLNPHNPDPIAPNELTASRQLHNMYKMKGGKNLTKKGTKRGGSILGFSWFNGQMGSSANFNPLNTIGDIATSQIGSNYISGNMSSSVLPNPSVLSQPVDSKYNIYNRPLA